MPHARKTRAHRRARRGVLRVPSTNNPAVLIVDDETYTYVSVGMARRAVALWPIEGMRYRILYTSPDGSHRTLTGQTGIADRGRSIRAWVEPNLKGSTPVGVGDRESMLSHTTYKGQMATSHNLQRERSTGRDQIADTTPLAPSGLVSRLFPPKATE